MKTSFWAKTQKEKKATKKRENTREFFLFSLIIPYGAYGAYGASPPTFPYIPGLGTPMALSFFFFVSQKNWKKSKINDKIKSFSIEQM